MNSTSLQVTKVNQVLLKKKRKARRRRLKGKRGRGTAQDDKPHILGTIQRNGMVIIRMIDNVQKMMTGMVSMKSMSIQWEGLQWKGFGLY